jgi:hypothetical protein
MTLESSAPAETPASGGGSENLSVDQAVSLLGAVSKEPEKEKAEPVAKPEKVEAEPVAATEGSDEQDIEATHTEGEEATEPVQPEAPKVKPPASWSKEAAEHFEKLPPELQEVISNRESEREKFANTKAQEAATARKEIEEFTQWAQSELGNRIALAQASIEGDFAGIDWIKLQQTDPQSFLVLDGMRRERFQKLNEAIQTHQQLSQKAQQEHTEKVKDHLKKELDAVVPFLQKEIPDFKPDTFKENITKYLVKSGVPENMIGNMSNSWELQLATKAMLYDQQQAQRASAAAKVANAPKVMPSQGKAQGDAGSNGVKNALTKLSKTGSVDDAVAALRAIRGARLTAGV